jgi:hypothetical protein
VYMFGAPKPDFGAESSFYVLLSRTHFRVYQGHRIQFLCFALLDSFWAVMRVPVSFFMFRAPGLIFGGTEGVSFSFHISRSRTSFRRYNGRWVQCSCFALPDPISTVQRAPEPVFMFCASRLILGGIEGVRSSFYVLRYRWRRVPFLCFAILDSFSAVPRVPGIVFMF